MKTRMKFGLLAAGIVTLAGAAVILISSGKGKKFAKKLKRKADKTANVADQFLDKMKAKYGSRDSHEKEAAQ